MPITITTPAELLKEGRVSWRRYTTLTHETLND
jgi:hypothetical protein